LAAMTAWWVSVARSGVRSCTCSTTSDSKSAARLSFSSREDEGGTGLDCWFLSSSSRHVLVHSRIAASPPLLRHPHGHESVSCLCQGLAIDLWRH
jgi:hypothetical protein